MILIADSGSTKADWTTLNGQRSIVNGQRSMVNGQWSTEGFNPYLQTTDDIVHKLKNSSLQQLADGQVSEIWLYGAGCTPGEKSQNVAQALNEVFGKDCLVHVSSDMLGAARALCQREPGIACILGTGSNSCLYDGSKITSNTPPLGFILGDEGSGAHLGKLLVSNVLKGQMSAEIKEAFFNELGLTQAEIVDRVYRQPMPNRWLASLSPFVHRHLDKESIRAMTKEAFTAFFIRNVMNYGHKELPIGLVGSVAYHYQEVIKEAAADLGLKVGTVMKSPMEGLIRYHSQEYGNN
ncbi:MAG: ATPase [Bacteroidaceae bacterium]|nr:ATPase [Bacteroidaceae bacterium]